MSTVVNLPKNGHVVRPNVNSWIDDWFGRDLNSMFNNKGDDGMTLPAVNIRETAEAYCIDMAAPGLKKSDFNLHLDHKVLSIEGNGAGLNENNATNYTRREFGYASFKRNFTLPETVEDSKIEAHYDNGILTIYLPKREEAKQKPPRTIQIR